MVSLTLSFALSKNSVTPQSSFNAEIRDSNSVQQSLVTTHASASFLSTGRIGANSKSLTWSSSTDWSSTLISSAVNPMGHRVAPRQTLGLNVVCSGLPHANWSARAIRSFGMAELEARKLKYPTTGTETLVMGILAEGTSRASKYLRANGVSLFGARDEAVRLLGKGDLFFFSPEHPPVSEPALKALQYAIEEHRKQGADGEIPTELILLGIWEQRDSAGHEILANLGLTEAKVDEFRALIQKVPA